MSVKPTVTTIIFGAGTAALVGSFTSGQEHLELLRLCGLVCYVCGLGMLAWMIFGHKTQQKVKASTGLDVIGEDAKVIGNRIIGYTKGAKVRGRRAIVEDNQLDRRDGNR